MGNLWTAFVSLIFEALNAIYGVVGDWGLAIIVLTILFRLLIWPLAVKQTRSMQSMQKLQPLMKEIQEKYPDDREKQNEAMMKLYEEHGVNPMAGCLQPMLLMLLPMPLLVAFFQVLQLAPDKEGVIIRAGALAQEFGYTVGTKYADVTTIPHSLFGFIPNIMSTPSKAMEQGVLYALPYIILLLIFGASIILPTLITPQTGSQASQQKTMSYTMAAFMLFIGYSIPAGALLYYGVSSLIAVGQQYLTQQTIKKEEAAEEALVLEARGKKKNRKKLNSSNADEKKSDKADKA